MFKLNRVSAEDITCALFQGIPIKLTKPEQLVSFLIFLHPTLQKHDAVPIQSSPRYKLEKSSASLILKPAPSPVELVVLKLSVSYIVNLMDDQMSDIYRNATNADNLWSSWTELPDTPYEFLPATDHTIITELCNNINLMAHGSWLMAQEDFFQCKLYIKMKVITIETTKNTKVPGISNLQSI